MSTPPSVAAATAALPPPGCRVIGFDRDPDAATRAALAAEQPPHDAPRPFGEMRQTLAAIGLAAVDGIVFDLGVSSFQLDQGERGFSFQVDGPSTCAWRARADRGRSRQRLDEPELARLLFDLGDEPQARSIARAIAAARRQPRSRPRPRSPPWWRGPRAAQGPATRRPAPSRRCGWRSTTRSASSSAARRRRGAAAARRPAGRGLVPFRARTRWSSASSIGVAGGRRSLAQSAARSHSRRRAGAGSRHGVVKPGPPERAANPRARSARLRVAERLAAGRACADRAKRSAHGRSPREPRLPRHRGLLAAGCRGRLRSSSSTRSATSSASWPRSRRRSSRSAEARSPLEADLELSHPPRPPRAAGRAARHGRGPGRPPVAGAAQLPDWSSCSGPRRRCRHAALGGRGPAAGETVAADGRFGLGRLMAAPARPRPSRTRSVALAKGRGRLARRRRCSRWRFGSIGLRLVDMVGWQPEAPAQAVRPVPATPPAGADPRPAAPRSSTATAFVLATNSCGFRASKPIRPGSSTRRGAARLAAILPGVDARRAAAPASRPRAASPGSSTESRPRSSRPSWSSGCRASSSAPPSIASTPRAVAAGHVIGFVEHRHGDGQAGVERSSTRGCAGGRGPVALSLDLRSSRSCARSCSTRIAGSLDRRQCDGARPGPASCWPWSSLPDFDPNRVGDVHRIEYPQPQHREVYELGSVFKILTIAAACWIPARSGVRTGSTPPASWRSAAHRIGDDHAKNQWLSVPRSSSTRPTSARRGWLRGRRCAVLEDFFSAESASTSRPRSRSPRWSGRARPRNGPR